MEREAPPVTVTTPGTVGPRPDLLEGAHPGSRPRPRTVLALLAVVVLGAAVVFGGQPRVPAPPPPAPPPAPPPPPGPPAQTATSGVTATASLAGARTDEPFVQRLTLTVDLPPFDARSDPSGYLLGDEVRLVGVQLRGFSVRPDDARAPVALGRFGRAASGRTTMVKLTAAIDTCSIEPQARRDIVVTVRTGDGPTGDVRAVADADVVRALDRLVGRTCRRPRG